MNKIVLFTCIFLGLLSSGVNAQNDNDRRLGKRLDSLIATGFKPDDPGISVLVANKKGVVYKKAFGLANLELDVPMRPDMIFRIGSVTKQFTAIGILQLVQQGKISVGDSIQKYIPDFPTKKYKVSIENLLTHTSGIPDYSNADTTKNPYIERHDFKPKQIIKYFDYMPLEFEPGTKYNYSNSGYALLAYIIEQVTGKKYQQYIKENVIEAAGLKHTLFAHEHTIIPNRVSGYTRDNGFFENCEYQTASMAYGCGDLMSTTEDLYLWNKALLSYRLINKELLQKAFSPYKLKNGSFTHYGYGWFVDDMGGKRIHHEGQVSGFTALESYYPDKDIYVSILTNLLSGEDKTDYSENRFRLYDKILSIANGEKLEKSISLDDSQTDKYVGIYSSVYNNKTETLTIYKNGNKLYMDLGNGSGKHMLLQALSPTQFVLPDVKRIRTTCEFIQEKDAPLQIAITQEKRSVWVKTN